MPRRDSLTTAIYFSSRRHFSKTNRDAARDLAKQAVSGPQPPLRRNEHTVRQTDAHAAARSECGLAKGVRRRPESRKSNSQSGGTNQYGAARRSRGTKSNCTFPHR